MFCRTFAASITLALATSGVALAAPGHEHVVAAIPQTGTPAVDDGAVFAITQAGSTMVIGGRFTSVDSQPRSRLAAFDLFDRRSMDAGAPDRPASRWGLWGALLVIPLTISILRDHDLQGLAGEAVRYTSRLTEAFLGTLLVGVYLWLRRRTAGSLDGPPANLR